jgi:hypothetical protein
VVAAGLSGIAQATWLAGGLTASAAGAPAALRFGVGAWPAIAAAVCAHLLHLLTVPTALFNDRHDRLNSRTEQLDGLNIPVQPAFNPGAEQRTNPDASSSPDGAPASAERHAERPAVPSRRAGRGGGAAERARTAARAHSARHGRLPTVSQLASVADVSRGTAAAVLKRLRGERPGLQLVVSETDPNPDS